MANKLKKVVPKPKRSTHVKETTLTKSPSDFQVASLSDYLDRMRELKEAELAKANKADFLFRGQNCDKPLLPHMARLEPNGESSDIEKLVLNEFKRTSVPYIRVEPRSTWDWLALAQHHGLPTRLLDWTFSALAALWFSVQRPVDGKTEHRAIVWVFRTQIDDFINLPTQISPLGIRRTKIFRPRVIAERINAQLGAFTCHARQEDGKFVALERNKFYRDRLTKCEVTKESFADIGSELFACGVNRATLFPDLDGVSALLKSRYFKPN